MDIKASESVDESYRRAFNLIQLGSSAFPPPIVPPHPITKYTQLPELGVDPIEDPWLQDGDNGKPRLRRVVYIDNPDIKTSRSLKAQPVNKVPIYTRRKIVTISEDGEKEKKSPSGTPASSPCNRAVTTEVTIEKTEKEPLSTKISALRSRLSFRSPAEVKHQSRNTLSSRSPARRDKVIQSEHKVTDKTSAKNKDKEPRNRIPLSYTNLRKKTFTSPSDDKACLVKNESLRQTRNVHCSCRIYEAGSKKPKTILQARDVPSNIRVPLQNESENDRVVRFFTNKDSFTIHDHKLISKDAHIATDPPPKLKNKVTEVDAFEVGIMFKGMDNTSSQTEAFDCLDIPNVTLTKDRNETPRTETLPNLDIPQVRVSSQTETSVQISAQDFNTPLEISSEINIPPNKFSSQNQSPVVKISSQNEFFDAEPPSNSQNGPSFIISRTTLTYTSSQQINFQVLEKEDATATLTSSPLSYPINVVSIFKKEISNCDVDEAKDESDDNKQERDIEEINNVNAVTSLNYSYVLNSRHLIKPSDIINAIIANNHVLQSDHVCQQFQRELNFIDSFFESLQYLENFTLAERIFPDNNVEKWITKAGLDLNRSLMPKLENGGCPDYSETMASKSLCLLNLLIRHEQRRAKNLLFVLKMREDALKDFTKSQILWLENKKKQDNTDISTLKKKQRGALLKLQHECGEMQRMRKALLTLSERRKFALIKTKKNIELKLRNSVDVDQILLGKKKLKRSPSTDRSVAPIKCFDLSSSGCEDASTPRQKSETEPNFSDSVASVDKTSLSESVLNTVAVDLNETADNHVSVDGSYLNILFSNLSLPPIFNKGKFYEVNEEAVKNLVNSANSNSRIRDFDNINRIMEQLGTMECDQSTSPSTARSLVDELDQYYKGLSEDKSPLDSPEKSASQSFLHVPSDGLESSPPPNLSYSLTKINEEDVTDDASSVYMETEDVKQDCELPSRLPNAGPTTLSYPVSDTSPVPSPPLDVSSITSIASMRSEAEELRRQQLAIEREIRALEEQKCHLLVVREIPDKPPPPYTPPNDSRVSKQHRMFLLEDITEGKVKNHITLDHDIPVKLDAEDPLEVFVKDFCEESVRKQTPPTSEIPWDSCNLPPRNPPLDIDKLARRTKTELEEVLSSVKPTVVPGVGTRRSDHIDDVLFTEWRRCEPEWNSLHSSEGDIKNQIFESIYQNILNETIAEYKKAVISKSPC